MSDTTVRRSVTWGQIKQYLSQIGEDPESDAFTELFDGMKDEDKVEENECDDLAAQFRDAGAQVDMEKASQMIPGMTISAETVIEIELVAAPAAEPNGNDNAAGTDPNFTSDPPPPDDDPILVPVEEGPPEPPGATEQFESAVPFEPPSVHTFGDEDARVTVPVPVPFKAKVEEKKKSSVWLPLLGVVAIVAIVGFWGWNKFGEDESSPPIVVQAGPGSMPIATSATTPAPKSTPTDIKTPTPTVSSQIVATCNITRYGLRNCTFQGNCTRFNTGSLYLEATCGNTQYRAQESEKNLPLGEGRKVTLIKNGT